MAEPAPPFALRKLDHVVLRVRNLEASLKFYLGVLGCGMERDLATIGLYQLRAGDSLIDLTPLDGPLGARGGAGPGDEGRNLDHFAIQVAPFAEDAMRAWLKAHGVEVLEAGRRYGAEGDGPSLYVADPDGNVVELKGPAE